MTRVPAVLLSILLAPGLARVAAAQATGDDKKAAERAPDNAVAAPVKGAAPFSSAAAVQRGCDILLGMLEGKAEDEWPYEGVYRAREGEGAPVIPIGYRVGGTAIVCLALITAPGFEPSKERQEAVARGMDFIVAALEHPLMQPSTEDTYDVRGWGHIYALHLFATLLARGLVPPPAMTVMRDRTEKLVKVLNKQALPRIGGWNYANRRSAAPFMTGPALQAIFAASAFRAIDDEVVAQALDSLERARAQSGSVAYSSPAESRAATPEDQLRFMDKLEGSMGRMLVTEATLNLAGRGDQKRLQAAVDAFFAYWDELEKRRKKTGTHLRPFGVAPYYFVYAHAYAAQAIEMLQDATARDKARAQLTSLIGGVQEEAGGWNDRVFDRSRAFGTAMMILAMTMPESPAPAAWRPAAADSKK